jgi:hypothetical protein
MPQPTGLSSANIQLIDGDACGLLDANKQTKAREEARK